MTKSSRKYSSCPLLPIGTILDADSLSKRRLQRAVSKAAFGSAMLFVANDLNVLRRKGCEAVAAGLSKQAVRVVLVSKTPQAADDEICAWLSSKSHRFSRTPRIVTNDKLLKKRVSDILKKRRFQQPAQSGKHFKSCNQKRPHSTTSCRTARCALPAVTFRVCWRDGQVEQSYVHY